MGTAPEVSAGVLPQQVCIHACAPLKAACPCPSNQGFPGCTCLQQRGQGHVFNEFASMGGPDIRVLPSGN